MAFATRPDGLIDVDTPLGPMPMAPDVAMQLGYSPEMQAPPVPTLEQAGATAGLTFDQLDSIQPDAPQQPIPEPVTNLVRMNTQAAQQAQAPARPPSLASQVIDQGPAQYYQAARPAGWVDTARTQRGTAPVEGPAREAIEGAQDRQLEAQNKFATAEGAIADQLTAQAQAEAAQAQAQVQAEQIRRQEMDRKLGDLQRIREERRAAVPDTLDPNRWDKSGGIGQVLAAVSITLGGIAQGMNGGENPGRAIIDGIIDRDIQSQREEIRQAELLNEDAQNDYSEALALYGDPVLAQKQLEVEGYEAIKKEFQARMQGAQGEQAKAIAAQGVADMESAIALRRQEMDGRGGELITQQQYDPGQSAGLRSEGTESWLKRAKLAGEVDKLQSPFAGMNEASQRDAISRIVALPDGRQAFATTTADAQATNKLIGARARYVRNLEEMRKIIQENAGRKLDPKLQGRLKAMVQENKIALKDTNELGAITASDAELVTPLSGEGILDWASWDENTVGALDEAQRYVDGQLTHRMGNLYSDPFATPESKVRAQTETLGARDAGID